MKDKASEVLFFSLSLLFHKGALDIFCAQIYLKKVINGSKEYFIPN